MKRGLAGLALALLLAGGVIGYRTVDACGDWRERYKQFLYTEMMKNSPVIFTPEMIGEIVGGRPFGCDRPDTLTESDVARFNRDGVDRRAINEEIRAAYLRTNGFQGR